MRGGLRSTGYKPHRPQWRASPDHHRRPIGPREAGLEIRCRGSDKNENNMSTMSTYLHLARISTTLSTGSSCSVSEIIEMRHQHPTRLPRVPKDQQMLVFVAGKVAGPLSYHRPPNTTFGGCLRGTIVKLHMEVAVKFKFSGAKCEWRIKMMAGAHRLPGPRAAAPSFVSPLATETNLNRVHDVQNIPRPHTWRPRRDKRL